MTDPTRTKGQVEADISVAITRFEKEHLGRGPEEVRTFIIEDLVLIRLKGVLTPAEKMLAMDGGGAELIKQVRLRLIESSRDYMERIIQETTGAKVVSLHTDISTRTGERILVLSLDRDLEAELRIDVRREPLPGGHGRTN
jgi:uncharacterized protein YbcI